MRKAKLRDVEELAEQCLEQGLIDRYEAGERVRRLIGEEAVHLKPKLAQRVLSAILEELGEGSPSWMPLQ